ncbi:hypothetical protein F4821DRAFT_229278 [Hypoxylon rubiginosum]|uniref:Uncharacterized protein n=1 Tax=Hypoxylon rubiginosum TaxID=110542 RepID=A0ACC0DCX0_9PEZI|nr:hypothetical protein F4821DRAFT_229278 [Hypoxylon rubiginosum]
MNGRDILGTAGFGMTTLLCYLPCLLSVAARLQGGGVRSIDYLCCPQRTVAVRVYINCLALILPGGVGLYWMACIILHNSDPWVWRHGFWRNKREREVLALSKQFEGWVELTPQTADATLI